LKGKKGKDREREKEIDTERQRERRTCAVIESGNKLRRLSERVGEQLRGKALNLIETAVEPNTRSKGRTLSFRD
jgi:hypothetical protein